MQRLHIFSALGLGERPAAEAGTETAPEHVPGLRLSVDVPAPGSRRRRLWELEAGAYCPVVGVCVAMPDLRRLAARFMPQERYGSDYDLHGAVVSASRTRCPLAEALQRDLEQRFRLVVRRSLDARDRDALAAWWSQNVDGHELGGTLWATLTHPRCDVSLAQKVIGEVHMLQHQVGTKERVEAARIASAVAEKDALARELADAQARVQRISAESAQRIQSLEAEVVRLRAALVGRDSMLAQQGEQLQALEAAATGLREQGEMLREIGRLTRRVDHLRGELERARAEVPRESRRCEPSPPASQGAGAGAADAAHADPARAQLGNRAVLCVGGRPSSVPIYRDTVERTGARFLHHDGGDADRVSRLDEAIRAADLVICQTGCISHGAYWQVKDHCKRTGTPCLFVETPSRTALERALFQAASRLAPDAGGDRASVTAASFAPAATGAGGAQQR